MQIKNISHRVASRVEFHIQKQKWGTLNENDPIKRKHTNRFSYRGCPQLDPLFFNKTIDLLFPKKVLFMLGIEILISDIHENCLPQMARENVKRGDQK